ncbi:hypothetical protein Tco_0324762, partial [Tanacetum coccineum]
MLKNYCVQRYCSRRTYKIKASTKQNDRDRLMLKQRRQLSKMKSSKQNQVREMLGNYKSKGQKYMAKLKER